MKRTLSRGFLGLLLLSVFCAFPIQAANRFIVRINGGLPILQQVCTYLGCTVTSGLDGPLGQVYLLTVPPDTPAAAFLGALQGLPAVANAEQDAVASVASSSYTVPPALYDSTPYSYFGMTVPDGYVHQPATQLIGLSNTQSSFPVKGAGTVAVIDTGIDPNHPTLRNSLVPGYDFTRNQSGEGDETLDLSLSSRPYTTPSQASWTSPNTALTQQSTAAVVDQSTAAVVDQSTAAVVDGNPQYSDFGHGTMVAGIIHLVAPGAMLMPLKAFSSNGTGYTSDIVRATYWAVQNHANVINMSFNLASYSQEMATAVAYATLNGVICVAAAGNQDENTTPVYPADLKNVISVASTSNADQRSSFSNYGTNLVWLAAPGEGVVTTYPFGAYAAGWGTSFSAPFVSGVAALMLDYNASILRDISAFNDQSDSANAVAHAKMVDPTLNHGRLDSFQAVSAWRHTMGK